MKLEGIPAGLADAALMGEAVHVTLDERAYSIDALYGASYAFVDRCWVFVDRPDSGRYRVVLAPRSGKVDADSLEAMLGELANELRSCMWRDRLIDDNRTTMEAVTMEALAGDAGAPAEEALEETFVEATAGPEEPP